jgi:hypothetical protein
MRGKKGKKGEQGFIFSTVKVFTGTKAAKKREQKNSKRG